METIHTYIKVRACILQQGSKVGYLMLVAIFKLYEFSFSFFSFLFVYLCKNIIKGVISITPLILLLTDTVLILFGGFFVVFLFYA